MPERPSLTARLLRPIVQLRDGESTTALLMFLFSFLAMTSYNIIKPITRSEFIASLGADNLPYVQFGAGVLIGFIMQGYTRLMRAGAAPADHPGDAGRHRGPAGAVLVPVHDDRRRTGSRSRSTSSG